MAFIASAQSTLPWAVRQYGGGFAGLSTDPQRNSNGGGWMTSTSGAHSSGVPTPQEWNMPVEASSTPITLRVGAARRPARKSTKAKPDPVLPQVVAQAYNPNGCVGYVKPTKNQQKRAREKLRCQMEGPAPITQPKAAGQYDAWSTVANGKTRNATRGEIRAIRDAVNTGATQHPPLRLQQSAPTVSKANGGFAALDGLPTEVVDEFPSIGITQNKARKPAWGPGSNWVKTTDRKPLPMREINRPPPLTLNTAAGMETQEYSSYFAESPDYAPPKSPIESPTSPITPIPLDSIGDWANEAAWIDGHEQRKQEREWVINDDKKLGIQHFTDVAQLNKFHNDQEIDEVNQAIWDEILDGEQENDGEWYNGEDAMDTVEYI